MAPTITIYDAVDVAALPANAEFILAYIDGGYVTYPAVKKRFPNATVFTITVTGHNRATICDVEEGAASPAAAAQGLREGLFDTIYCSPAFHPSVAAACEGLSWQWYCSAWNPGLGPYLYAGSIATQWAAPGYGSPGNYDISLALASWAGIDPPPTPTPTPVPPKPPLPRREEIMGTTPIPTAEFPNRVLVTAIGAADGNGRNEHLLMFTINDATNPTAPGYNVIDVTDGIGTAQPYTVQSA